MSDTSITGTNLVTTIHCQCRICYRHKDFFNCQKCLEENNVRSLILMCRKDSKCNSSALLIHGFLSSHTIERKKKLHNIFRDNNELKSKLMKYSRNIEKRDKLKKDINELLQRKMIYQNFKKIRKIDFEDLLLQKNKEEYIITNLRKKMKRIAEKKMRLLEYMATRKNCLIKTESLFQNKHETLEKCRRKHMHELFTYIFPIREIPIVNSIPMRDSEHQVISHEHSELEEELAEARGLLFSHGRWFNDQIMFNEKSERSEHLSANIVTKCIDSPTCERRQGLDDFSRVSIFSANVYTPADGNYSFCEDWMKSTKLISQGLLTSMSQEASQYMPKYATHAYSGASVHSALCFAMQALLVVRKLLDVYLPYKQHYKLLYEMNEANFKKAIKRLNYNALAICVHNNTDLSKVHPLHTLRNINHASQAYLLTNEKLGDFIKDDLEDLVESLENALNDGSEPPSDNEDVAFENSPDFDEIDWDKIRTEDIGQSQLISGSERPDHPEPFQSIADETSMSQGLVSSAMSWMTKAWWTK